jgi:putative transposase
MEQEDHVARPIRLEFPGALYHVMSRGVGGSATFWDDDDRTRLLDGIGTLIGVGVLIVHAFCLMTNHFHLLCETPIGKLGRWMHMLLSSYSRDFNRRHFRAGHLWQARYKAILVEPGSYFLDCSRYIHINPVRAAIVRCAEEYPWSSYRSYLGLDSVVDWVSSERVLAAAGGLDLYKAFVESGLKADDDSPFERATAGLFFGDRQFVKNMSTLIPKPRRPVDLSRYGSLNRPQPPPTERLVAIVDDILRDWSLCQRRRALAFLLRGLFLMKGTEVAQVIGRSEVTASEAWHVMERRMAVDQDLANRMNELFRLALQASE